MPTTERQTTWLHNAWYMAGWSDEIGASGLARQIIGSAVFLFRKQDGTAAAILDRCPHRFAPLSLGIDQGGSRPQQMLERMIAQEQAAR